MGYWKAGTYYLSGDGNIPSLTKEEIINLASPKMQSIFKSEVDGLLYKVDIDGTIINLEPQLASIGANESSLLARSNHSGFDRQKMLNGGKNLGVLEFCQNAASGIYWRIDYDGTPTKHLSQITFGDGTPLADRTLVQYKATGESSFEYWYQGELIQHTTTKSLQLGVDEAKYIYYNENGDMSTVSQNGRELIIKETLISFITDTTTFGCDPYFADERHGILMSAQTHLRLHMVDKFRVITHGEITGVVANGKTFTDVSVGKCGDEDIPKILEAISTAPKMYKIGNNWGISDNDNNLALLNSSISQVNKIDSGTGAGSLVDLTGNDRMGMVMVACNDSINPIRIMVGQTNYNNRATARKNVPYEWERVEKAGLPSPEMTPYFTFIIKASGGIETGLDAEIYMMNKNGAVIPMYQ